ncbi:MAG: hypothetical protein ACP5N9_04635 [Candidatus Bilamarchaeum sp.]
MSRLQMSQVLGLVKDCPTIREAHTKINARLRDLPSPRVWAEFLDFQKEQINNAAQTTKARDRAIVYGAGNCQDFNLEFLADYFGKVVLVDIEEEGVSIARGKLPTLARSKVDIQLKDASSCIDSLIVSSRPFISRSYGPKKSFENLVRGVAYSPDVYVVRETEKFDFVLSTDLASTISLVPIAWLYARFCEEFPSLNVDFVEFQKAFLPYMQASLGFHLASISGHFNPDTLGVVTANSVECPFLSNGSGFSAVTHEFDRSGGVTLTYTSALGMRLDTQTTPHYVLDSIGLTSPLTGFGPTNVANIFVIESDPKPRGENVLYPKGTVCEILEIGQFAQGTVVPYTPKTFIVS